MKQKRGECLTPEQISFYNDTGYLVLENHLELDVIQNIRDEIARLELLAVGMTESDDRFDLEDSHKPDVPRIRRIKLPHTQSNVVKELLYSDSILAPVRDLIGPNVRLRTTKLNMKSAEYGAPIEWHQDLAFYPYTNDDVLAVGIIIDDMESKNGPLMVYPGTHKGPIYNHHINGVFAGGMSVSDAGLKSEDAVELKGPAGSVSIHHGRIVHGSAKNTSDRSRRLMFFEMTASDAFPIIGSMDAFKNMEHFDQQILCGEKIIEPRLSNIHLRIPQPQPDKNKSIYEIQKAMNPSDLIT